MARLGRARAFKPYISPIPPPPPTTVVLAGLAVGVGVAAAYWRQEAPTALSVAQDATYKPPVLAAAGVAAGACAAQAASQGRNLGAANATGAAQAPNAATPIEWVTSPPITWTDGSIMTWV